MAAPTTSPVRPLVAKVKPIAGETLMSLIARACDANVFERPSQLISAAGFTGDPRFVAFTGMEATRGLSRLLKLDEAEIASRMHGPVTGFIEPDLVAWFGSAIESRFLERCVRRVGPAALALSAHHRAEWTIKALSFCPETFQELITHCPSCDQELGWWKTEGLARCEHCRARLDKVDSPCVSEERRPSARLAANLVSPDPAVRERAVDSLPDPFSGWSPAELFTAVVELGAAWEHPHANRRSPEAKALARGRLDSASARVLASGWNVLSAWPESLAELVRRAARLVEASEPNGSRALRDISLLGRHLDRRLPQTAFRSLLREQLGLAAHQAKTPIKLKLGLEVERADKSIMTLMEAASHSGISARLLKRLCPEGQGFAGGRGGQGGALRFHTQRVLSAARLMDDALSPAAAAARLGIPEYCLSALIRRKLVQTVDDPDVLRMKRLSFAVSSSGICDLRDRLAASKDEPSSVALRLDLTLAHRFAPAQWAQAFAGLLRREAGFSYYECIGDAPLTRCVYVDRDLMSACVNRTVRPRVPHRGIVTAQAAATLLGIGEPALFSLIHVKSLPASRTNGAWSILLKDLVAFDRRWILSSELDTRLWVGWRQLQEGKASELSDSSVRGWNRDETERFFGPAEPS